MKRLFVSVVLTASFIVAPLAHADTGYVPIGDPYTDTIGLWSDIASALSFLANNFAILFNGHEFAAASPATPPAALAAAAANAESAQAATITYTVQAGDTLSGIAQTFAVPLSNILAANDLSQGAILHPGETLIVPDPQTAPATSSETAPNATSDQATLSQNVKSAEFSSAQSSSPNSTNVIEAGPAFNVSNFVTQSELTQVLLALSTSPSTKSAPTTAPAIPLADGNPLIPYAAENNITNLSGVTISNANLTASEIPDLSDSYLSLNGGAVNGTTTIETALGIGTTTPWQKLSVNGNLALTGAFYDRNSSPGLNGYILQSTGAGVDWVATSSLGFGGSSQWTTSGSNISYSAGDVGIGTTSPDNLFDIAGSKTDIANFGNIASTTGYPGGPLGSNALAIPDGSLNIWDNNINGWGGAASAFCLEANHTYPFNCQVSGDFSNPSGAATYTGRDQDAALIEIDSTANIFGGQISGTFDTTHFYPATPLTATQTAGLRVGMVIDTNDSPTPYSGIVSGWDTTGGTYVTVEGWYLDGTTNAGAPSGTAATISPEKKLFAINLVTNLDSGGQQTEATGGEVDCNNKTGAYNSITDTPTIWCWDLVNLGNATSSQGLIVRGNTGRGFQNDIDLTAAAGNAGILIDPTQIDGANKIPVGLLNEGTQPAVETQNTAGQILGELDGSGDLDLGNQSSGFSTPALNFYSSGSGAGDVDSNIFANGGDGVLGSGDLTIDATQLSFVPATGGKISLTYDQGAALSLFGNGTGGNPYLDFSSATSTNYDFRFQEFPASNRFALIASSSGAVVNVLGTGKVGIGNSNPLATLDVSGFVNTGAAYGFQQGENTILYASSTLSSVFAGQGAGSGVIANATSSSSTSGPFSTALGYQALGNATSSAYDSVAVGYQALLGSPTAGGTGTLGQNTAVGFQTLYSVTSGNQNSALGYHALSSVTTGTINIGIGLSAGNGITSGTQSIAIGNQSQTQHNGNGNVGIGSVTLSGSGTGGNNVAIGNNAGNADTAGSDNIFLGYSSASTTASGSNNIALGYDIALPSINGSNQLNIGNLVFGTNVNGQGTTVAGSLGIGTSSPSAEVSVWGPDAASSTVAFNVVNSASTTVFSVFDGGNAELSGSLSQSSDQRLKTNIQPLNASSSLSFIDQLNPVTFNWVDPEKGTTPQLGFIAQQVLPIFPDLVSTTSPTSLTPDGTLSLNYIGLISPIVSAIQQLSAEISSIENTIAGLAQSITTHQVNTDQLCVQGTCINGSQLAELLSSNGNSSEQPDNAATSSSDNSDATDTRPVIQINGDNPAIVQIGDTYNDLGATITGPQQDLNLGIQTFVNGTAMSPVQLDTSTAATDTIDYVATDQNGLTSTTTRTVIMEAPSIVPSDDASSTDTISTDDATTTAATSSIQ